MIHNWKRSLLLNEPRFDQIQGLICKHMNYQQDIWRLQKIQIELY